MLVAVRPVPDEPSHDDFRSASAHALAAIGLELEGERLVIKPNVTSGEMFADPDSGITTHPHFVHGIADYLLEHGAHRCGISILEDPRNTDDDTPRHWRGTGYPEIAAAVGADLVWPTTANCVTRTVRQPHAFEAIRVSGHAVDPDAVLINVPKLKTHNLAITTLCMKNLMGTVYTPDRHYCRQAWLDIPEPEREGTRRPEDPFDVRLHERWQEGLARRLIDTAQVVTPQLNLVEGVVGRDGTGFRNGANFALGLAVAGINMVAVDTVATYLMGFDPSSVVYLRMAGEAGLGPNTMESLRVYVARDGSPRPCEDPEPLRARPAFRVISRLPDAEHIAV